MLLNRHRCPQVWQISHVLNPTDAASISHMTVVPRDVPLLHRLQNEMEGLLILEAWPKLFCLLRLEKEHMRKVLDCRTRILFNNGRVCDSKVCLQDFNTQQSTPFLEHLLQMPRGQIIFQNHATVRILWHLRTVQVFPMSPLHLPKRRIMYGAPGRPNYQSQRSAAGPNGAAACSANFRPT